MGIEKTKTETVLVLQGGGSLGAYECGVYKTLSKHNIKFDMIAGTSIGAINASIIAGAKSDNSSKALEDFWFQLAETFTSIIPDDSIRAVSSSMQAAIWGNANAFRPIWFRPDWFGFLYNSPYLYDMSPLKKTLNQFVDFTTLKNPNRPRLLVTSTDIKNAKPTIFDSKYDTISAEHVLASAGYPFYGIAWTELNGRFLWDGTLLSNTPLREVIHASPRNDKRVFIVNLFPKNHDELPRNMSEAWHRARDIMHTDKTDHNIRMSKIVSRYLELLREMHDIITSAQLDENGKGKLAKIEQEYHKLACDRGAIIEEIIRIERQEETHFLLEDADFSIDTIKNLIQAGEKDAELALKKGT
ncbi:MAG: patatin-like phospholipase family protein [Thaumarchaeota archaeon]|nr:patatin-like phospholipase family protein [Nitrososphaerota archaeon]